MARPSLRLGALALLVAEVAWVLTFLAPVVDATPAGEAGPRRVLEAIVGEGTKDLVVLTIDGDRVTATGGHPCWVVNHDTWIHARDLQHGDVLLSLDGGTTTINWVATQNDLDPTPGVDRHLQRESMAMVNLYKPSN